ncbi:MAG: FxLYD domain-containing protein [Dehalococcoidia bacterium]
MLTEVVDRALTAPDLSGSFETALDTRLGNDGVRFDVTYGPQVPLDAQLAIEYAVSVWALHLATPVPIRVRAVWLSLPAGALAFGGPNYAVRNVPGAPQRGFYYPAALADRFAEQDLEPGQPDMIIGFSRSVRWYTGLDGQPGKGQFDLVTVALQEIGHGLGMVDSGDSDYAVPAAAGDRGLFEKRFPLDALLRTSDGKQLVSVPDPSAQLVRDFLGGDLFFDGPAIRRAAGGPVPAYSPPGFMPGSSLAHLDEASYPDGHPDALMTPFLAPGEVIHHPGPLLLAMMDDIGWGADVASQLPSVAAVFGTPTRLRINGLASDSGRAFPVLPEPTLLAPMAARAIPAARLTGEKTRGLSIAHATWRVDADGGIWAAGEVHNDGKTAVGRVGINITGLDAAGRRVDSAFGDTVLLHVAPGADTPFLVEMPEADARTASVALSISRVGEVQVPAPEGLAVAISSREVSAIGVLHVRGLVHNTSNRTWQRVIPIIAFYDAAGNVLDLAAAELRPTTLASGQRSATFDFRVSEPLAGVTDAATRVWVRAEPVP